MLLTKPLLRCPGSLSCWKTQPRFIFNALADGRRFSLKISRYMAPFILSFTQISRPGPFAEKLPQSMMFPPPCFTVGMVFFGCNSAFFLLQTRQVEFLPKSYILVSSDHMTFSQSSSGSSKFSLANFRRAWTCTGLSRWTRLSLQDLSPWRRSVLLMVAFVTLVPALCRSFTRSPRVVMGFLITVLVIILTPRGEILHVTKSSQCFGKSCILAEFCLYWYLWAWLSVVVVMFEAYNKSVPLSSVCVCLCIAETARIRERTSEILE